MSLNIPNVPKINGLLNLPPPSHLRRGYIKVRIQDWREKTRNQRTRIMLKMVRLCLLLFSVYLLRTEGRIAGSRTGNRAGSHNQPASCTRTLTYSRYYDLNRVCNDCFKLYDDPHIYGLCRGECFTSQYFYGCLSAIQHEDAQLLNEDIDTIRGWLDSDS
ncbi:uncharacterized protein LOC111703276 isoform X2 [Eurytemora carolleeae]|uniref:uncharacterized protein LOC111703276 isoform X2 n=1 Tax=Eurytemora carolleeae TaxID=1294199 RepID=UPI000C78950E|nr:uncharacterized protein LOC111703276 isoform X2 [Eurytemora carolleeae]|eukprot:XP_023330938.1 uncharacterized protein LOC111703276 isoform X2 [Eurytemora affinis]